MWWTTLSSCPWDTKWPWTESPLAAVAGALVTCFPSCQLPLALSFSPPLCSVFVPLIYIPYFVTAGTELQAFHGVTWRPFQCNLTCFPDSLIWLLHLPVYSVYFQYAFFFSIPHILGFPGAQIVKCLSAMQETRLQSRGWEETLEKEMAAHSSTLAWKIPWTEKPGRLQSMGWQRMGHDWATSLSLHFSLHILSSYLEENPYLSWIKFLLCSLRFLTICKSQVFFLQVW